MLTPQEASNSVFEKAVFGGYDIAAVDQFVEKLAGDYGALYRENETLKDRLRLLGEQIEEYRVNEDAMRLALLSAKKAARAAEERADSAEATAAAAAAEKMNRDAEEKSAAAIRAGADALASLTKIREAAAACEAALAELCGRSTDEAASAEREAAPAAAADAGEVTDFGELDFRFRGER